MTPSEYLSALAALNLSQTQAAHWLGVSLKTARTYATKGPSGPASRAVSERIERERLAGVLGPVATAAPELLECLEGILAFTDGFGFYRTQSPAGIALEQWIEAARDAVSDATSYSDLTAAVGL